MSTASDTVDRNINQEGLGTNPMEFIDFQDFLLMYLIMAYLGHWNLQIGGLL